VSFSDGPNSVSSWPKHRFVGLAAGKTAGGFFSDSLFLQSGEICIDADVRGWLRAELCDIWGNKKEGFHLMDCQEVTGDATHHVLKWEGESTANFIYEPVRLRFEFYDATVYSVFS